MEAGLWPPPSSPSGSTSAAMSSPASRASWRGRRGGLWAAGGSLRGRLSLGRAHGGGLGEGAGGAGTFFTRLGAVLSDKAPQSSPGNRLPGFRWDAATKEVSVPRGWKSAGRGRVPPPKARSLSTWRRVVGRLLFLREACGPTARHAISLLRVARGGEKGDGRPGERRGRICSGGQMPRSPLSMPLVVEPVGAPS